MWWKFARFLSANDPIRTTGERYRPSLPTTLKPSDKPHCLATVAGFVRCYPSTNHPSDYCVDYVSCSVSTVRVLLRIDS